MTDNFSQDFRNEAPKTHRDKHVIVSLSNTQKYKQLAH